MFLYWAPNATAYTPGTQWALLARGIWRPGVFVKTLSGQSLCEGPSRLRERTDLALTQDVSLPERGQRLRGVFRLNTCALDLGDRFDVAESAGFEAPVR